MRTRNRLAEIAEAAEVPEATAKRKRTGARNRAVDHETANLEAARIIAADPARYPGLLQDWARTVLARLAGSAGVHHARGAPDLARQEAQT